MAMHEASSTCMASAWRAEACDDAPCVRVLQAHEQRACMTCTAHALRRPPGTHVGLAHLPAWCLAWGGGGSGWPAASRAHRAVTGSHSLPPCGTDRGRLGSWQVGQGEGWHWSTPHKSQRAASCFCCFVILAAALLPSWPIDTRWQRSMACRMRPQTTPLWFASVPHVLVCARA